MAFALFSCFTTSSCYQELDDKELIVERLEANARFTKLCQSVECSEFPLNYHSSRIGETWYFFPYPDDMRNTILLQVAAVAQLM